MAGHSKWSKIKRDKGANDAKRGAVFTKIGNMIAVAAKQGTDPTMNPALALAIEKAKQANMPNANVQRAIDRANDKNAAAIEEVTYEGYGPGGVAFIIEAATDNKNRTYPEVRTALTKQGGTMAEPGSVMFQFERKGIIRVEEAGEEALLVVLEAGADDANEEEGETVVYTDPKSLHEVAKAIRDSGLNVLDAELGYVPTSSVPVEPGESTDKIMRIMDAIDDVDDVVNVHTNADFQ